MKNISHIAFALFALLCGLSIANAEENYCLEFNNDSSAAIIDRIEGLKSIEGATVYTFECWLRPRSQGKGGRGRILEQINGKLTWYLSDDERFGFRAGEQGGWRLSGENAIHYWEWQHVAVCSDGTYLRFFVNGKPVGRVRKTMPLEITSGTLWLGNGSGPDKAPRGYDGWLDELRVSDIARYVSEFTPECGFSDDSSTVMQFSFDDPWPAPLVLDESIYNSEIRLGDPLGGTGRSPRQVKIE